MIFCAMTSNKINNKVSSLITKYVESIFEKLEKISSSSKKLASLLEDLKEESVTEIEAICANIPELKKEAKERKSSEKKLKDPNAPKRPCSAYILFSMETRPKLEGAATEKMSECGRLWRDLSEKNRVKYVKAAEEEKKKYSEKMKNYVRPSDDEIKAAQAALKKPRKNSKKSSSEPKEKKAPTGYLLFIDDLRKKGFKGNLRTDGSKLWKELSEDERKSWNPKKSETSKVPSVKSKKSPTVDEEEEEEEEKEEEEEEETEKQKKERKAKEKAKKQAEEERKAKKQAEEERKAKEKAKKQAEEEEEEEEEETEKQKKERKSKDSKKAKAKKEQEEETDDEEPKPKSKKSSS